MLGLTRGALLAALVLASGGCGRKRDQGPILTQPAPAPDGRVAFVSRSRIWIAAVGESRDRRAEPLPIEAAAERPRWLVDSTHTRAAELVLTAWFGVTGEELWQGAWPEDIGLVETSPQADLALWNGTALERLTLTPRDELLCDAADDRLLFESRGMLYEAALDRSSGQVRLGDVTQLVPGRDARYTPDGRHILFVRGHESDPLGIWRQGYQGGDDSEIYHLDFASMVVTQITDTTDNDEQPIPLDDAGRRFIVCRERGGLPYRPWIVEVLTPKKHRVRRLPMPEGPWPVLFPAVRWLEPPKNRLAALVERDTTLALEVWAEANGELITTSGKVQPARLHFPAALRAPIQLAETPLPAKLVADKFAATDARQFTLAFAHAIESSPLANRSWQVIPKPDRWRLLRALGGSTSEPERADAALRLLGRCGLAGFDYWPQWPRRPITDSDAVGYRYLPHEDSTNSWIWDLRHYDRSMTSGWGELEASDVEWAGRLCAERKGPGVVLIDEKTANRAEVVAAGLRAGGCAVLLGRTTSGLATLLERHPVPLGSAVAPGATKPRMAIITVPIGPVKLPSGTVLGPEGVVPDRFVPPGASEEVWQAAANEALEHLRR